MKWYSRIWMLIAFLAIGATAFAFESDEEYAARTRAANRRISDLSLAIDVAKSRGASSKEIERLTWSHDSLICSTYLNPYLRIPPVDNTERMEDAYAHIGLVKGEPWLTFVKNHLPLVKNYKTYCEQLTTIVTDAALQEAFTSGRPLRVTDQQRLLNALHAQTYYTKYYRNDNATIPYLNDQVARIENLINNAYLDLTNTNAAIYLAEQQSLEEAITPISAVSGRKFTVGGVTFTMIPVEGGTVNIDGSTIKVETFSIGKTEVTQELWQAVMGNNPSWFKGPNLPVETASWNDCQDFIRKLNAMTGYNFRLPTEAEWEYAARGGNKTHNYIYSGSNDIDSVAWYYDNSGTNTHPVASKAANELGIYDMSGSMWEWCQDLYNGGPDRVNRGGSWYYIASGCEVSNRNYTLPDNRYIDVGLRLAL